MSKKQNYDSQRGRLSPPNGANLMVAQQKTESSPQAQINEDGECATSASAAPADPGEALVNALDSLLLERALEEHRVALARLNKLKIALGKD